MSIFVYSQRIKLKGVRAYKARREVPVSAAHVSNFTQGCSYQKPEFRPVRKVYDSAILYGRARFLVMPTSVFRYAGTAHPSGRESKLLTS